MGRRVKRIVAGVAVLLFACLAPATPAVAEPINRSLDLQPVNIGGGYDLSGLAYKSSGSVLLIQLRNGPQTHSADLMGGSSAVRFSDSLRRVSIDMVFDGGFGSAELTSKVPAGAVHSRRVEGCSGKKYSVMHELSGILKFKTGSSEFGTIRLRRMGAKLTATSANFQCQPVPQPCPRKLKVITTSGSDFALDARKSNGKAQISLSTYDQVSPDTAIYHRVSVKLPGNVMQLSDDLSNGFVDASSADPDLGGSFSFAATAAGTADPGDCGVTYHQREGDVSGVSFHAEFDWGGSYYPFVGGPTMGSTRYTEVP